MDDSKSEAFVCGIFKLEIKNRFLCSVAINDVNVTCYIPSSCRLSNFVDMLDREVLLKPIKAPNARTAYSLYAIKHKKHYVLVNLAKANKVMELQMRRRYFSFLGSRKRVQTEYRIGSYKTDIFIHDTNTLIEIKSILAFSKEANFPSVYSERAVKQLNEIASLLEKGYKACYVFVSLNSSVKQIKICQSNERFYNAFVRCVNKGMSYCAFSIILRNYQPEIYSKIKVTV